MALKFNGAAMCFATRWYDTATGEVKEKAYTEPYTTEIEFSRAILKTKKRNLKIHPDHVPSNDGFWINGYQADKDQRITFTTGVKDKLVISKNAVDFMFCTTNQSYASCYRLQNGTESSLKRMHKCPGIYIVYTTQEDGEYEWHGVNYKHPKMSGRAFLYESEDKRHYTCGRPYGKVGLELRDVIRRWLPNGLEIGWELSNEQRQLVDFERDNFGQDETTMKMVSTHDRWDYIWDTGELYYQDGLNLKLSGIEIFAKQREAMNKKMAELKAKALKTKQEQEKRREHAEIVAF